MWAHSLIYFESLQCVLISYIKQMTSRKREKQTDEGPRREIKFWLFPKKNLQRNRNLLKESFSNEMKKKKTNILLHLAIRWIHSLYFLPYQKFALPSQSFFYL